VLISGLVSISFRNLNIDEIINIVKIANLKAIEWGGDLHVPHGDLKTANYAKAKCNQNSISCPSYGSYYRVGTYNDDYKNEFLKVLEVARILECKTIRIWVGDIASKNADEKYIKKIISEIINISQLAAKKQISISFEFHSNTLTDTLESTLDLLKLINKSNVFSYWQPPVGSSTKINVEQLSSLLNYLSNIHIFNWNDRDRLSLIEGVDKWKEYINVLDDKNRYIMLEFVKDDSIEQFYEDAKTLKELINEQ